MNIILFGTKLKERRKIFFRMSNEINEQLFNRIMHLSPQIRNRFFVKHNPDDNDMRKREIMFARERILGILLEYNKGLHQKDIAEIIRVNPSSMSELIDKLENDGYVKRITDTSDKRATIITLTPIGKIRAYDVQRTKEEQLNTMFENLTCEEKEELIRLLNKFTGVDEIEQKVKSGVDKMHNQKDLEFFSKQEISELISRYFLCWDERRFNMTSLKEIFTDSATVKLPPTEIVTGFDNIVNLHVTLSQMFDSTHHMTSNILFNFISDNEAECRGNLSAYHLYTEDEREKHGSEFLIVKGILHFTASYNGGQWLISKLEVKSIYRF